MGSRSVVKLIKNTSLYQMERMDLKRNELRIFTLINGFHKPQFYLLFLILTNIL